MREAFRVLEPGGRIGLSDYTAKQLPQTLSERSLAGLVRRLWHVPAVNVVTADGLARTLRACGFADVRVEGVADDVIPGYYREGRKPENVRAMDEIRGWLVSRASLWIDHVTYRLYQRGLLDYVFAFGAKPSA